MNNSLRNRIQSEYYELTNTNKLIADTIFSYKDDDFNLKLVELAQRSFCSNGAVTKFIKYFGYSSYKLFSYDLNSSDTQTNQTIHDSFSLVDTYIEQNKDLVNQLLGAIAICSKVYVFASGQSQISAIDFTQKSNKKEKGKFIFEPNPSTQRILIDTISKDDLVIFISNSGESRELLDFIKHIKNTHVYLVTNREKSSLAKQIPYIISLNNTIESHRSFKEFSKESKYSLLYFFDYLFEQLYFPKY